MEDNFHGNLSPENFDPQDFIDAIQRTHGDQPVFNPPGMHPDLMRQLVSMTGKANREAGREVTYASALSWGVTLGVVAERIRRQRANS